MPRINKKSGVSMDGDYLETEVEKRIRGVLELPALVRIKKQVK